MDDFLVDFETAKELNLMGFPLDYERIYVTKDCETEEGDNWYSHKTGELVYAPEGFSMGEWISAPMADDVNRWFIDRYQYYIDVSPSLTMENGIVSFGHWFFKIHDLKTKTYDDFVKDVKKNEASNYYDRYEDALIAGIKALIEMKKNIN